MLTYHLHPRRFRFENGESYQFPNTCSICFHFVPKQPFGADATGGRTAVAKVPATLLFDANSGRICIESQTPLKPLTYAETGSAERVELVGNLLNITKDIVSLQKLSDFIHTIYFYLPALLSVNFSDPVLISFVDGKVGDEYFRWELDGWRASVTYTTQDLQEERFARAWRRVSTVGKLENRRIFLALHYLHQAQRLSSCSSVPGEFLSEMLLNLSKVLEVLFPSSADIKQRDSVRRALMHLGFSVHEVERDYLPAMALRNEIDVGHIQLELLNPSELRILHSYILQCEDKFKELLERTVSAVEDGTFNVREYSVQTTPAASTGALKKMARFADEYIL